MDGLLEDVKDEKSQDFPDFVGPMLVKELRQGMRARRFVIPFVVIHFVMIWALFSDIAIIETTTSGGGMRPMMYIFGGITSQIQGQSAYWFTMALVLLVVVPLGGTGLLQKEMQGGNVELLLITNVSRWQVVRGQWLVLCLQGGLIFLATIPYLIVRYSLIGGFNVVATIVSIISLICLHAMANALAVALSGYGQAVFKILIGGFSILSVFITSMIIIGSTVYILEAIAGISTPEGASVAYMAGLLLTTVYFTIHLLQVGRARIRLFEKPYEPPQSRGMVTMVILSPLIMGFAALATVGYGVAFLVLLLIWTGIRIDRVTPAEAKRRPETVMDEPIIRV